MTRPHSLFAFFLSCLTLAACKDVPIGGDSTKSRLDAGKDATLFDASTDAATCSGANPAAQTCRTSPNQCIPSTCTCSADGFWHCTADCPVNVPLCADAGAPDVAPDIASPDLASPDVASPDVASPDVASPDVAACSGTNPATQKCRKTVNECIPSSCSCSADGLWQCTVDCPANVPLCADAGAPDVASDAFAYPTDEQSCLKATDVPHCDFFGPSASITSAASGPLLAKVQVTSGSCSASTCTSGCERVDVLESGTPPVGTTCDLLVTSTDGRSRSFTITVVANPSPSYTCCGSSLYGHGIWTSFNSVYFSPNPIVVDFPGDGGVSISDGGAQRTFTRTGSMTAARTKHTATLLANGKVLIVGGSSGNNALASAELYDPATGAFASTGPLTAARLGHTATLLASGKVLIVSGSSAELYDPAAGTFTATDNPTVARTEHTATLLASGKVLVAGGYSGADALVSAELYDPATEKFTATGNLTVARRQHAATLLQSGTVLLAGGFVPPTDTGNNDGLASAEIYDPATAIFTATGSMQTRRSPAIATLLTNGTVLVGGGWHGFEGYFDTGNLELYAPATGQFSGTGGMAVKRTLHTATLLPSGSVLIAGGFQHAPSSFVYLSSAELCDQAASTCTATAGMAEQREYHSATALPDGTVLIAGGDRFGSAPALASAEIYK